MINTEVGELAVWVGTRRWLFRPSLLAMARLGTPEHIVHLYAAVHGGFSSQAFLAAVEVLWACNEDEDTGDLTGYCRTYGKWVPGKLPPEDVHILARSLMVHGVTSSLPPERPAGAPDDRKRYTRGFQAAETAALAMAHLGLSERDAWNMTMTGVALAMRAKYHDASKPTVEQQADDADETLEWLKRVNAMRESHAGR